MGVTKHAHYLEHIFTKDKDHLQIVSVIDDPEIFTKPQRSQFNAMTATRSI